MIYIYIRKSTLQNHILLGIFQRLEQRVVQKEILQLCMRH